MKKIVCICLSALCLIGCSSAPKATPEPTTTPDVFTSASTNNFYEASSWTGDQLIEAIKNRSGSWTIATVNPDNTPNLAVAVFGMLDDTTLVLNLAPNQTGENIVRTKEAVAIEKLKLELKEKCSSRYNESYLHSREMFTAQKVPKTDCIFYKKPLIPQGLIGKAFSERVE